MKAPGIVGRAALVGVVFVATQSIATWLVPMKPMAMSPHAGSWWLLSTFIAAATLTVAATRSGWRGWRPALAVALIPLAIQLANLTEAVFFLKSTRLAIGPLMLRTLIAYALAIPALVPIFGTTAGSPATSGTRPALTPRGVLWRFAACDVSYLFLYYLAGTIVITSSLHLRAFYQAQGTPPAGQIVAMQLLLRGPVFVGLCILLAAMMRLPRATGALAVGLAFTLLSGVVPLLVPNPFMPDPVRWVHFGEVVSSNLVFGSIVALLWSRRREAGTAHDTSLAAPMPA